MIENIITSLFNISSEYLNIYLNIAISLATLCAFFWGVYIFILKKLIVPLYKKYKFLLYNNFCLRLFYFQQEIFRDSFLLLESNRIKKNTGNRYNFVHKETPFVGRDFELQILDKFMQSEESFLWYTIYGEIGAGKSRLGLELCNIYSHKEWDSGFFNWEIFTKNACEIESWRPKKATLLIVECASSYPFYMKSANSYHEREIDYKKEISNFIDLLRILIKNSIYYQYKVRILFLVRFRNALSNDLLKSEDKFFHEQIILNNPFLREDLKNSSYDFLHPIILKNLDDDSLQEIISSIVIENKVIDEEKKDFIEQLEELNLPKTPLSAFLLATVIPSNCSLCSKESLLSNLIQSYFLPVMHEDFSPEDIYLLLLATIMNGASALPKTKYGVINNINLPNIWEDNILRKKFINNGFAQRFSDLKGVEYCKVLPIEPNLLGEYFVLNGYKTLPIFLGDTDIPLNLVQDLFITILENVLYQQNKTPDDDSLLESQQTDVIEFLLRCGDNFPNEQLKNIIVRIVKTFSTNDYYKNFCSRLCTQIICKYNTLKNIHYAKEIYNELIYIESNNSDFPDVANYLLATCYAQAGKTEKAQSIYDGMDDKSITYEGVNIKARLAYNLISTYCAINELSSARLLFKSMNFIEKSRSSTFEEIKAAYCLIIDYCKNGHFTDAKLVFERIQNLDDFPEFLEARAQISSFLIKAYCSTHKKNLISLAQKLFNNNYFLLETPNIVNQKINAIINFMNYYLSNKNLKKALYFFSLIPNPQKNPHILWGYSNAILSLTQYYAHAQNQESLETALRLYEEVSTFTKSAEVKTIIAKVLLNLIYGYIAIANMKKALSLYEELQEIGNNKEITIIKAQGITNLILGYVQENSSEDLENAQNLFNDFSKMNHYNEVVLEISKSSVNLIRGYSTLNPSKIIKAYDIYASMPVLDKSEEYKVLKIDAMHNLILGLIKSKRIESFLLAQKMFLDSVSYETSITHQETCSEIAVYLVEACSKFEVNKTVIDYAEMIYNIIKEMKRTQTISKSLSKVTYHLIDMYVNMSSKNTDKGEELLDFSFTLGKDIEIQAECARGTCLLVKAYLSLNDIYNAKRLLEKLNSLHKHKEIVQERAYVLYYFICFYVEHDNISEASETYKSLYTLQKYVDIEDLLILSDNILNS